MFSYKWLGPKIIFNLTKSDCDSKWYSMFNKELMVPKNTFLVSCKVNLSNGTWLYKWLNIV